VSNAFVEYNPEPHAIYEREHCPLVKQGALKIERTTATYNERSLEELDTLGQSVSGKIKEAASNHKDSLLEH